jgi:sugar phosphate isomerase/epimerase
MMQVGIFTGYFPYELTETADKIRALGFNTVQLDLQFKDMDLGPGTLSRQKCDTIRRTFRDHNLPICCISGYTNIVHPDPGVRAARLSHLRQIITHARFLGTPYVISETGTFDPDSDWVAHPANATERGWDDCREVISELARHAHDHGAVFVLETYVNNVVGSIAQTLRMFNEVNHPGLGLLMDPANYFEAHNIDRMDATLNAVFDALGDRILIAHAKDVKRAGADKSEKHSDIGNRDAAEGLTFRGVGEIELPAPGLGELNYDLYLARLGKIHPNIPIIVEHLDEADAPRAKRFLDQKLNGIGV